MGMLTRNGGLTSVSRLPGTGPDHLRQHGGVDVQRPVVRGSAETFLV